jgi:hypothetical protein
MSVRSTTQSAMDRGVDFLKIVAWAGLLLAGAFSMLYPLELLSTSIVPICFVAADSDTPAPAAIEISVKSVSATNKDEGSAQLFGMDTEPVANGALLDKWRRVQADITKDLEVCRAVSGRQAMSRARKKAAQLESGGLRSKRSRTRRHTQQVD